ncbi:hypothetical protein AZH53_07465 [Methanomicrobiaceae archaeon CYW5]|uniref:hypothetical protein n=1 Tax=Methanovulcanius yangii TaxID=1789227 RepID=UPI0029CA96F4|nr:hypothetical protein [Methanovulcanius yangii]MBT8508240.1 hypothetical protein [Methanovulcanius yangii]
MIPGRAQEIVQWILNAAGYDVDEGDGRHDLSAFNDRECVVILCSDERNRIEEFAWLKYRISSDSGPEECRKLLVTGAAGVDTGNCTVWNEEDLARQAAKATLSYVQGERPVLTFDAPVTRRVINTVAEEEETVDIPHLPVTISQEKAVKIAGIRGAAECRFIPYWVFELESTGEIVYKSHVISFDKKKVGTISAINGLPGDFTADIIDNTPVPASAQILTPKFSKTEAAEQLIAELIKELSKTVRVSQPQGDTICYEDREFRPERSDITVDLSLVYVPVWQIRGNRIVEVNAYTGDILEVPMDDGVEVL